MPERGCCHAVCTLWSQPLSLNEEGSVSIVQDEDSPPPLPPLPPLSPQIYCIYSDIGLLPPPTLAYTVAGSIRTGERKDSSFAGKKVAKPYHL
jgi:hypothetical protein